MTNNGSMSVYDTWHSERGECLQPVGRTDFLLLRFDGRPRAATWKPMPMRCLKDFGDGLPVIPVDFPRGASGGDLPMTDRAKAMIEPYIGKYGEFLPLACDEGKFWTFHATHFVDALNEEASQVHRASDEPGYILSIQRYVFRPEKLTSDWLFNIPQTRGRFYVTDPFVNMINASGLTGLRFKKIWPHT